MPKHVPSPEMRRFAQRLRSLRVPRGYKTARSFAEKLGIHENRYTRYERAEVEPDLALILQISSALAVTPNDLLCETPMPAGNAAVASAENAGFSERPAGAFNDNPTPRRAQPADYAFQTAAWQLAVEIGEVLARKSEPDAPTPAEALGAAGDVYRRLEADPFAVLADIGKSIALSDADLETQKRIAAAVSQLVGTLRGSQDDEDGAH